ncbi:discoidin domain-containing protein [Ralstonia pseudosolanacearum]|uniref:Rhs-related transmembrane protein n=2 Tax=Ralstonia pseudosolanacearum TaxID=1310165 RepID=Q8XSJ7_RALN1|nr:discoidin domain-containing protein [Ralstonia pseudosolanacearum]AST29510.1 type IV secretion protein Rhs [Ralstonia pseudosolanacearum]MDC6286715.1 discoidin domain-containing protein [Ralstonia pseudosolanacearum]MDC6294305.1 discoidin domain-containing protein [Ralstonia pseudosolanacearum]MDD7789195.1 discoidin domain-containing protein [Ralstonia pseudosolanacearum]MDN3370404.1 discoidin domain-containing protein [Ralstonia pseudosolanacearum]
MYLSKSRRPITGRPLARTITAAFLLTALGISIQASASVPVDPGTASLETRLREARVFEEPLIATGPSSVEEQQALWQAVQQYRDAGNAEAFAPLQSFLTQYPNSAWGLALRTNLGLTYYRLGYFSRAMDAWEAAWRDARAQTQPETKRLADRALGELVRMHARIGHADRVTALLEEAQARPLQGPATEAIAGAREGLWLMRNEPGVAYLCGPMALKNILEFQGADRSRIAKINAVRSSPQGVTLDTVGKLAQQVKLPYTIARRSPGTPIPLPAVVHWKINHYAAIVAEENGQYHLKDPTFGRDLWISKAALEAETSNYFLIPKQAARQPGWKTVAQAEAKQVFGMGATTVVDETRLTPNDPKACDCKNEDNANSTGAADAGIGGGLEGIPSMGMPSYNVHAMLVSLNVVDTPVGYRPPKGPAVNFTLTYNQRDAHQPANFTYFNFGPKWTSNWLSYVQDDPASPGSSVMRYVAGGGVVFQSGYNTSTGTFTVEAAEASVLVRTSATSYERRLSDGSKEVYAQPDGATYAPRRVFLTQIVDRRGNAVTLTYDGQQRLTAVTDALGKRTTLGYGNASNPLLVTQITDPFGRMAQIGYDASGLLSDITDAIGMKSSFSYDAGTFINAMTTPYGTTHFAYGESGMQRWINITDPLGQTERVEYAHPTPGMSPSESQAPAGMNVFNEWLHYRNTYYWNAKAYAESAGDYTKARLTHWFHAKDNSQMTAGAIESTKEPQESRVWYKYANQVWAAAVGPTEQPTQIGRVRDDGTTERVQLTYNAQGNLTTKIDAAGQQVSYDYASNGIDVVRIYGLGINPIAEYTYDDQHNPLTYRDAAGQVTTYTYNAAGQKTSETNALGQTTRWEYDNDGFLQRVVNASGKADVSFTYDAVGRVASRTDAEGYTLRYQYDALNRLTQIQYPDNTTRVQAWDKLDLASVTDQMGRVTRYAYNSARNRVRATDPLGRATQYDYYPNGKIKTETDANGTVTAFTYTPSGRLATRTVTAAGGAAQTTSYSYDGIGQLTQVTQHDGSTATYKYDGARRLTAATDTQGNSVQYTLDQRGNHTQDQLKDPSGNPTRQVDRVFDAMNRPVQVTQQGGLPTSAATEALIKVVPVGVTASSTYSDNVPARVIDGVSSNAWIASGYAPQWIEVDLGAAVPLKKLRMLVSQSPAGQTTHVVTGGMNPAPTSVLQTVSRNTVDGQWLEVSLDTAVSVRYIRISTTGSPSWVSWHELEFYRTPEGASTLTKILPTAVTASGYYSSNVPGQAVDGKNDTSWTATDAPQWIEVDLGAVVPLKKMRLLTSQSPAGQTTHVVTADTAAAPTNVLQTFSGNTTDNQWLEASRETAPVNVRYVRIQTTSSPSWVSWHELEFYR